MSERVQLHFLQPYERYCAGEVAGFTRSGADRILNLLRPKTNDWGRLERSAIAEEVDDKGAAKLRQDRKDARKPKPELVAVRFFIVAGRYVNGDVAGFPAEVAERYVKGWRDHKGQNHPAVAHYADAVPEAPATEPEPESEPEAPEVDEADEAPSEPAPKRGKKRSSRSK
jgi:hypothetical protein